MRNAIQTFFNSGQSPASRARRNLIQPALFAVAILLNADWSLAQQTDPRFVPVSATRYELTANEKAVPAHPAQLTTDPRRPLDSRIQAMPRAEEKLEVIHHRSQLVVAREQIRRVAWSDPLTIDVVQFSPTEISILGLEQGTTDLWIWFEGQEQPLMYVVTVIRDPSLDEQKTLNYGRIERKIALLYPNSKVYLIPMSRKIIVRGQARDAEEAANIMQIIRGEVIAQEGWLYGDDFLGAGAGGAPGGYPGGFQGGYPGWNNNFLSSMIINELQIPGEFQISVRVRIAELQRSQLRRLGVDWTAIINDGAVSLSSTLTGGTPLLTGIFDDGNITVLIDALASNGVVKVLNDARMITLSGQPAAFLAGGEFAVPTIVGVGGAQGQQTSFRGFGTSVICTPTLLDNDLIRLQIVPELSELSGGNVGGIPSVNVRRVQTKVELREGQTIVLGGLFSRRENAEVSRIPFLGEVPVVGSLLFNTKQATEDENEMLIIVTPELVRPMDPDQVPPLPGWYSTHPNNHDLYKYNRIEGNPDLGNYQLLPYGNGQGYAQDVGYSFFNPPPADGQLAPAATGAAQGPYPQGMVPATESQPGEYGNVSPGGDYPSGSLQQPFYQQRPTYPQQQNNPQQPSYQQQPMPISPPQAPPAMPGQQYRQPTPVPEPAPENAAQRGRPTGVRPAAAYTSSPRMQGYR